MQDLKVPYNSSFHKYYEIDEKRKNYIKELSPDEIALIEYIYLLLSIKQFREGKGSAYKHLNNFIIEFAKNNDQLFISKEAAKFFQIKNIKNSNIEIFRNKLSNLKYKIDFAYLIPIKIISKELFKNKYHKLEITRILKNLTSKIIINKNQKHSIKNNPPDQKLIFNEKFNVNNYEIEKLYGIEIIESRIKLIN